MGSLSGLRVVEMAGIGPGPFACMLLADMGAEVIRVVRPAGVREPAGVTPDGPATLLLRGRRSVAIDLREPTGRMAVLRLCDRADVLVEGYRPGVMERHGLGPNDVRARNPALVYGRVTGYGQDGPLAAAAGHDINYLAISGVLGALGGRGSRPQAPLNLVADFGGGGMLLAFGIVCAVLEARRSGEGQVVDAAMVDGAALLATFVYGLRAAGVWNEEPGTNLLDGGAHFYDTYRCADGAYVAVGAIEPQFYAALLSVLGLRPSEHPQWDRDRWPELRAAFAAVFETRSREEWVAAFDGVDACVTPVLGLTEAARDPHNIARGVFVTDDGPLRPAVAPRLSRTPGRPGAPPRPPEDPPAALLAEWGLDAAEIAALGVGDGEVSG